MIMMLVFGVLRFVNIFILIRYYGNRRLYATCTLCMLFLYFLIILPQGRIHQIEYAMEAVKQGSATIGIKSSTHVVLVALKVCDTSR